MISSLPDILPADPLPTWRAAGLALAAAVMGAATLWTRAGRATADPALGLSRVLARWDMLRTALRLAALVAATLLGVILLAADRPPWLTLRRLLELGGFYLALRLALGIAASVALNACLRDLARAGRRLDDVTAVARLRAAVHAWHWLHRPLFWMFRRGLEPTLDEVCGYVSVDR